MALGSNIKYQLQAVFEAAFDDKSAKQVEQMYDKMAKRVADSSRQEFVAAFQEFGTILNNALQHLNIQPIDINKLIELPNAQMFSQLGVEFGTKFTEGFKSAASGAIVDNLELENLRKEQQRLVAEREKAQSNIKNKIRVQELNAFDPYEATPLKVNGDVVAEAEKLLGELKMISDEIYNMQMSNKTQTQEYVRTVLDAQEKLNNFYRMRQTLLTSKTAVPKPLSEEYGLVNDDKIFAYSEKGDTINYAFEDISDAVIDASTDLQVIDNQLLGIEQRINSIVQASKNASGSLASGILGGNVDIEQARQRMQNKNGKTYNAKKVKELSDLTSDSPSHIDDSLEKLKFAYDKSVAEQQGWEVEYQWLAKFVQKYDELLSKGSNKKQLANFAGIYEAFMGQYPEAMSKLRELRDVVSSTPASKKSGVVDQSSLDGNQVISEEVSNTERLADANRRSAEEAKRKVKVEEEAATLAQKQRTEAEATAQSMRVEAEQAERVAQSMVAAEHNKKNAYVTGGVLDNPAFANMFKKTSTDDASAGTEQVNQSLATQSDLLSNIERLTSYIDEEYLSAGKHLSHFLNDLQTQSIKLDGELKQILTTLHLIDESGNLTFAIKQNGEQGGGTTHNGALISDMFTMIERSGYQRVKDSRLPASTQKAYQEGVNVAQVLDYIPSKTVDAFFDVQSTAKGHNLFQGGMLSQDVVNATEAQLQQLVNAFVAARNHGFDIENGGSNIVYDQNKGFSFYDLEEWSPKETAAWNALPEAKKRMRALNDALSIFGQMDGKNLNRDYTNWSTDPNRMKFVEKFKQAIGRDTSFKGLPYQDLFGYVFDEYYDENNNLKKKNESQTHQGNTAAINAETQAQEKLNQAKTQQAQIEQSDNDGAEVAEENAKTDALNRQNAVLKENISLKGKANAQGTGTGTGTGTTPDKVIPTQATSDGVTSGEVANLETIKAKLLEVTDAVNTKTKAFTSEEAEVKRVAQSEIASLAEIENKATSVKAAIVNVHTSSDSVHTPNVNTEAFTQEGQAAEGAITQEMGSLTKLRAALQLTTKRINEKTQAFETEKTVVNTVVNSEVNALNRLNSHVDKVNQIVLTLLQNLQNVNTQLPNLPTGQPQGAPQGKNTGGQSGGKTSPQLFNAKIDTRFSDLSLMYAKLESVGKLTPQIEQQWLQLWNSLSKVNDTTSLQLWNEELHQVGNAMKEIMIANDLVEQEGIQSFTQLINATKLYNQMAINAAKAKTSEEKAFWEQETNKALVEQQLILNNITLTKKQQAELDALIEQRQRTINGLQAKQTGAENVRREKQEEAVVVRELVELYEQLGIARAQGDYTAAGNIRGQIKAKRGQLSAVDRATDDKFAQATQRGEKTVADDANKAAAKAQNEALRERGKIFGDLIKLHRELGVLEEKEKSSTLSDSKRQQYRSEIYDLYRQISAKEQLIILTREEIDLLNQTHSDAGRSARISNAGEREADIKKLAGQYAKLGEAQANAEYKGTNEAKERFTVLAKEIAEKKKSLQLTQQELDILRQIVKESYDKQGRILNQEQQDKLFKEQVKEAQQQAGVNKSKTVANRAEETLLTASGIEGITPEQKANLDMYQSKILELRNTIANFPKDGIASEAQKTALINQRMEVDAYTKKIRELIDNYQRLSGENTNVIGKNTLGLGATADDYQRELIKAVQSDPMVKGRANIRAYDAETKTLTYTLKTGRGEFTTYTASIRQADNALVSVRGTTTRAMGVFESIGKKVKEYSYYFTGSMMVYRVIGWIREGVTAVKELDSAMTELKKVTDETEETYDKFLDTASKIGNKVGSTMKDIVSSTADWARLNI